MPTQRKNNDLTFLRNVSKYLTHFFRSWASPVCSCYATTSLLSLNPDHHCFGSCRYETKSFGVTSAWRCREKKQMKSLTLLSNALYFLYVLEDSQSQRKTACTEMRSNTCTHKSFVTSFWPASETNFHCSSSKSYSPFMI